MVSSHKVFQILNFRHVFVELAVCLAEAQPTTAGLPIAGSNPNPLDLAEADLIAAPVVEACRA
jgi:hypothetical protein